jgi:hypothetical protein
MVTLNLVINYPSFVYAGLDATLCYGDTITLNAQGNGAIIWNNSILNGQSIMVDSTMNYNVQLNDSNGCVSYDTLILTVNQLPAVNAGIDSSVCYGDSIVLSGSGALLYNWTNSNYSIFDNIPFSPIQSGNYNLEGIDSNGCINYDSVNINVNLLPNVYAGLDQIICYGDSTLFAGSGGVNYVWSGGILDGVVFIPDTNSLYTVIGTDSNGCVNYDTAAIFINSLPIVDAGLDTNICIFDSILLFGSGAQSYSWSSGIIDGNLFVPDSNSMYFVTGTDSNGCVSLDSITISIMVPFVEAGVNQEICAGDSVTLIGSGSNLSWSSSVVDSLPFAPDSTEQYVLTVQDANGCVNYDTTFIFVNELPNVFAGNDTIVCELDELFLNGSGAVSYYWDMGIVDGISFIPDSSDLYTVLGIDSNGCENTDTIFVDIAPLPKISSVEVIDVEYGNDGAIFVDVEGTTPFTYDWDNDGLGDMDDESNIYYLSSGEYQFKAYDSLTLKWMLLFL